MAQLTEAEIDHLELSLAVSERQWSSLPEVEREIDAWDWVEAVVFIEEWPLEEMRLEHLAEYAASGAMTSEQTDRYRCLLRVVEQNRPIIRALLAT